MENVQAGALVPYQKMHSTLTLVAVSALTFLLGFLTATVLAVVVYILMGHSTKTASNHGDRIVYLQQSPIGKNERTSSSDANRPTQVPSRYETNASVPAAPYPTGNMSSEDSFSEPIMGVPNAPSMVPETYVSREKKKNPAVQNLHDNSVTVPNYQPNSTAVPPGVTLLDQK